MVFILVIVFLLGSVKASNWYDSVVVRADNAYVSYFDSVSTRKEAPIAIQNICSKYYANNDFDRNQIFEIEFGTIVIYVIRNSGVGFEDYYFYAYDPFFFKLSDTPFVIKGKWCADEESGFDKKILNNQMIEISGENIILRERVHNGTSYNAVLLYSLICNEKLEFFIKYCIEECSLYSTPEMNSNEYLIIRREITEGLQVNCFLENGQKSKYYIGSYNLSTEGAIIKINVVDNDFDTWIVTTSGMDSQLFSKLGSSFYAHSSSFTR